MSTISENKDQLQHPGDPLFDPPLVQYDHQVHYVHNSFLVK